MELLRFQQPMLQLSLLHQQQSDKFLFQNRLQVRLPIAGEVGVHSDADGIPACGPELPGELSGLVWGALLQG